MKNKIFGLLKLFAEFFKIGLFTFGGGYAMIALMQNELVVKKKWITQDELADMLVIAESTPGPVAINSATYIGHKLYGFLGALCATLGVVIPSFVIIFSISLFFERFIQIKLVASAFSGIKAAVAILIISVGLTLFKGLKKRIGAIVISAVTFAILVACEITGFALSSVYLILAGGAVGIIGCLIMSGRKRK